MPTVTASELTYDVVAHKTTAPDGRDVPHVTEVLSAVGVSVQFAGLAELFGPRVAEAIDEARALGQAVHADCHAYDDNDLDWSTVDDRVRPYLDAWVVCREQLGLEPLLEPDGSSQDRERQIFDADFWYTGFLDGVFARKGQLILVDIKTGDPWDAAAHLQTAAYEKAWNRAQAVRQRTIDERWAIQLTPDRKVPYRVTNYSAEPMSRLHFNKFAACLTVYFEQAARRRK